MVHLLGSRTVRNRHTNIKRSIPLTDTQIRKFEHSGAPAGDKLTDGQALHLLVKEAGKYWRLNYRFGGKQKTLALGVYPEVSLAQARTRRDDARKLLAEGIDPSKAKIDGKLSKVSGAANTFESVARAWLVKTAATRPVRTARKKRTRPGWRRTSSRQSERCPSLE